MKLLHISLRLMSRMPGDEREGALSRAIVVEDAAAWDMLALCDSSLILIPTFPDRRNGGPSG